jgi:hypothetical protein
MIFSRDKKIYSGNKFIIKNLLGNDHEFVGERFDGERLSTIENIIFWV